VGGAGSWAINWKKTEKTACPSLRVVVSKERNPKRTFCTVCGKTVKGISKY